MAHISPYIHFSGKTVEALDFYKSVFGGETYITLIKDSPLAADMPADIGEQVFHSALKADGVELMATDLSESDKPLVVGTNIALGVMCDSEVQIREWYTKLSAGGTANMPVNDVPWGALYGECRDKYGLHWMLNYDKS